MSGCGAEWCEQPDQFHVDEVDGSVFHTHLSARIGAGDTDLAVWLQGEHHAGPSGVSVEGPGLVVDRHVVWGGAESAIVPVDDAIELLRDSAELLEQVRAGAIETLIGELTKLRSLVAEGSGA